MNRYFLCIQLLFLSLISVSQNRSITIDWEGFKEFSTDYGSLNLPFFNKNHFDFDELKGITYFNEWTNSSLVDEESIEVFNPVYQIISSTDLGDLQEALVPDRLNYSLNNVLSRDKRSIYFTISPIIKENGVFKKLISFELSYQFKNSRNSSSQFNFNNNITNSVLSSGEWYRFYIEKSGVYRISRSFLSSLGINVNSIDPRNIKIFGNGGRMLPLLNAANYPFDVLENAIRVVGEDDGRFDSNDFILFYAEGPDTFNDESFTNVNLFTDKTYYYINVGGTAGKRINDFEDIDSPSDLIINTFQDSQFYEVDQFNLAKLGRRWFGDRFDIETQRSYEFNFPNLIQTEPVVVSVSAGSISETDGTSLAVSVNGSLLSSLAFSSIVDGSILATASSSSNQINLNSDALEVVLDYNNGGNPSASAFLDFIRINATRSLSYANEQLLFSNNILPTSFGVAEFQLSNASGVSQVWDITDRFNVTRKVNATNEQNVTFKVQAGEDRQFIAFSLSDVLTPSRDNSSRLSNQNLKGTIFNDASGNFQDVDYLMLTTSELRSQAERLASINRARYNLNVKVVDLQTIYNEFSTGSQDIAAIRNFVKYVYDNASSNANRLKYLCLFGDGSYDYKNRIRNNTNIVPSWYTNNSFSLTNSFVSDDFYAMLDDNEGGMSNIDRMDIAVGRILAENPQRAREMVDKIEAYYQREALGSWRNNVLLISDDVDEQWERILQETTDGIANEIESEKPFFNVVKIHSDAFQQESSSAGDRYPRVNKAIRDAVDVGAIVVNYFGHGGEDGLADERVFDRFDAQEVNNVCKFNAFVTVTCEYTKFDDPNRPTAGEFTFWNKNGGAITLFTTTRQIFVTVGVSYNEVLNEYLFAYGSNEYPSIGEVLRLTKVDSRISGITQKRLVFLIGDPAMKLAFPRPDIRLTQINDTDISSQTDVLNALAYTKLNGEVTDENGNVLSNYNGTLTATVYDKRIQRQTLANDGVTDNSGLIKLDFSTLGEIIFKGQATVTNGQFEFDFIVPRDIGIPVGNGKVSFYAKNDVNLTDIAGSSFDIQIGGINENAPEDNIGPVINLFMNDENFVSGGITNESPILIANFQDENGINTASGIGHDITAVLDGDETNPVVLNEYYQANIDDYTSGSLTFPFRDLEPGIHTITLKAWDVYNNSSTSEIQFQVFDQDEELVINNVLNYPNPFVNYTEFWFNHNSSDPLDISIQIFTVSGKLVKTLNGQTLGGSKSVSSLSKDVIWDGRDDFGDRIGKGVYIYKLKVKSNRLNKQVEKIQKLVIL